MSTQDPNEKLTCFQCKKEKVIPIVAIMKFDPEVALASGALGSDKDRNWMAMPICTDCHKAPKVKAHFFERSRMNVALRNAGSGDIG